jgi:predicted dehydrogenase
MDYTKQSFRFRVRKALRYTQLYGPRRTWVKIRGQYHMKRRYDDLPTQPTDPPRGGHVGLIGCGNFAYSNIAYYLRKNYGRVIRGAMDHNDQRAASLYESYGLRYYTTDARRLIEDPEIDLVFIASNHASHAEYAIQALEAGKNVHIEKPHVVREEQLVRLCRAMEASSGRVALGFNRPLSRIGRTIAEHLASQEGPAMFNWFLAGHEIAPDHWYFKEEEGGRILGNLCHWTDFLYHIVPPERRYPITINPTSWEQSDCDIAVTLAFGDGSIGAITFSAKGHTFEGVRETFSAHRGNVLMSMRDFKWLRVEEVERVRTTRSVFRDHGHEARIMDSYSLAGSSEQRPAGASVAYVWETAELFLRVKESLESDRPVTVGAFEPAKIAVQSHGGTLGREPSSSHA